FWDEDTLEWSEEGIWDMSINDDFVFFRTNHTTVFAVLQENQPPVANAGPDIDVSVDGNCSATVMLDGSLSYDPDGDSLTCTWVWDGGIISGDHPTLQLSPGTYEFQLIVNDGTIDSQPDTVIVNVLDAIPPALNISVSPDTLWPPNHKMTLVTPTITVSDNCDPDPSVELVSITMNEGDETNTYDPNYDYTTGDGNTTDDIQVDENGNIYVRAERSGSGTGRIYTITYSATDISGNCSTASAVVTVPHNQ
ncbi:MAG TPA: PKD domain-containing protein, partial [Deltaproteobacteria bacterium]|nr:PKD domain-containing protein [Deltaproteobacteria bacterium]